jgi:hypothetical protein
MVTDLNVRTVGMYLLGLIIIAGCFYLIASAPADREPIQEWATITLIVGYLIRDAGGAAGTRAAERITAANAEAQPTVTTTSGTPPAQTTTTIQGGEAPTLNTRGSDLTGPTGGIG